MTVFRQRYVIAVLLPIAVSACAHRHADRVAANPQRALAPPPPVEIEPDGGAERGKVRLASHAQAGKSEAPPTSDLRPPTSDLSRSRLAPLALAELEQIALQSNPALMELAAVVDKARGIHEQVGLYPNPVVGYSGMEIGNDGFAGQQGGFVSQTIVTGGKLQLSRDVASWNVQEMAWEYQVRRFRVLSDVRQRYYDVLGAKKRLEIAAELLKIAERGVSIAEQLRQAKQASRADVLQAQVDMNEVRIIRQNAQYEYDAAWKRLTTMLGRPEMPPRELAGELAGEIPAWNWDSTYEKLIAESPQVQAARARVQAACLAIQRQQAQVIPNLLTQAGVWHSFASGDTVTGAQVGVPLPVFNRNQGNIRIAEAEYQRAVRNVQRLELRLRDRLAVAFQELQQASFQVERYEKNILKDARESLRLIENSYKAGQLDFLRVLTARRIYFESTLRYVQALIALRKANAVIDNYVLTGGLTDVPDVASRAQTGVGQRGQALSGQ